MLTAAAAMAFVVVMVYAVALATVHALTAGMVMAVGLVITDGGSTAVFMPAYIIQGLVLA